MYYRSVICLWSQGAIYSRTCLKRPHKNNTKIGFKYILSLNAGQKFCRMLQGEHSAKLSTFIKLPFVINIFVLSIFEWPLKTVFTVLKLCLTTLFCLFCCFTSQVNSYGHGGTVSSPNITLFLDKLEQAVNQYFVYILSLVTNNNPS